MTKSLIALKFLRCLISSAKCNFRRQKSQAKMFSDKCLYGTGGWLSDKLMLILLLREIPIEVEMKQHGITILCISRVSLDNIGIIKMCAMKNMYYIRLYKIVLWFNPHSSMRWCPIPRLLTIHILFKNSGWSIWNWSSTLTMTRREDVYTYW